MAKKTIKIQASTFLTIDISDNDTDETLDEKIRARLEERSYDECITDIFEDIIIV